MGLDYPCYPQLPGSRVDPMNMALQFLIPLSKVEPSIEIRGEEARLLSDGIGKTSAAVEVERAEYYQKFLRERGLIHKVRGTKACVTGPFTLASYLDRKNLLSCGASKPNVVTALARVLARSCKRLSDLGFDIVSIDEPFLSVMLGRTVLFKYDENFIVETLNILIKEISCLSAIHVCGTITPLVRTVLLRSEADILDHEFATSPNNVRAYSRRDLEQAEKLIAYGCVSSVSPRVETVEEISTTLRNAVKILGPRVMVKPDCGFGGLQGVPDAYAIVLKKLSNMVDAARIVVTKGSSWGWIEKSL